jgi:hypothetical protein
MSTFRVFKPLGHLPCRSARGGWFKVEPGNWQHFKSTLSEWELREEREWLRNQRAERLAA